MTNAALADEYEAGLRRMEAAGYEEFTQAIENHKLVIAALRASPPSWRPFKTAPKDGTPILCFHPDDVFSPETGIDLIWWEEGAGIWTMDGDSMVPFACAPTHWMPLPAAPSVTSRKQG